MENTKRVPKQAARHIVYHCGHTARRKFKVPVGCRNYQQYTRWLERVLAEEDLTACPECQSEQFFLEPKNQEKLQKFVGWESDISYAVKYTALQKATGFLQRVQDACVTELYMKYTSVLTKVFFDVTFPDFVDYYGENFSEGSGLTLTGKKVIQNAATLIAKDWEAKSCRFSHTYWFRGVSVSKVLEEVAHSVNMESALIVAVLSDGDESEDNLRYDALVEHKFHEERIRSVCAEKTIEDKKNLLARYAFEHSFLK